MLPDEALDIPEVFFDVGQAVQFEIPPSDRTKAFNKVRIEAIPNHSCGYPNGNRIRWNNPNDYGTSSNYGPVPDCCSIENGHVHPYKNVIADDNWFVLCILVVLAQ